MLVHCSESCGTVEETIEALTSPNDIPRSDNRFDEHRAELVAGRFADGREPPVLGNRGRVRSQHTEMRLSVADVDEQQHA